MPTQQCCFERHVCAWPNYNALLPTPTWSKLWSAWNAFKRYYRCENLRQTDNLASVVLESPSICNPPTPCRIQAFLQALWSLFSVTGGCTQWDVFAIASSVAAMPTPACLLYFLSRMSRQNYLHRTVSAYLPTCLTFYLCTSLTTYLHNQPASPSLTCSQTHSLIL